LIWIVARPQRFAGVWIWQAKDLERFEQGRERDLEVGTRYEFRLVIFAVGDFVALRYRCVVAVGGK
jgi:hypothetical protein